MERFEIRVSDSVLDDLRGRLSRTRFPDQLEGAGWDYGTELGYLQELCDYWQHKFDWRAQERKLNRFDQFKTDVGSASVKARVSADQSEAAKLGVSGTPSFFINGRYLSGAQPFEEFKKRIDEALAKG